MDVGVSNECRTDAMKNSNDDGDDDDDDGIDLNGRWRCNGTCVIYLFGTSRKDVTTVRIRIRVMISETIVSLFTTSSSSYRIHTNNNIVNKVRTNLHVHTYQHRVSQPRGKYEVFVISCLVCLYDNVFFQSDSWLDQYKYGAHITDNQRCCHSFIHWMISDSKIR